MRGQGRVYRPKIGGRVSKVWWLDYGVGGERHRESSRTTIKRDALEILRQRIGKRQDGTMSGRPERVTLAELKDALKRRYVREGNASWGRAEQAFAHLETHFKAGCKALSITRSAVANYQSTRLADGAARNTVRYECAILSAAFGVAVELDMLAGKPLFKRMPEGEKRKGFFDESDFAIVVLNLPSEIGALVRFLRFTGWRKGEGIGLQWAQIDWDDPQYPGLHQEPVPGMSASIRISADETKGGDDREFPFGQASELKTLLLERFRERNGLRVFHRKGRPVGDFRKVWDKACIAAGVPGKLVHDLRRTAARDFRRAGVSEGEIMRLAGWKTRSMFDRYNIIDSADLSRAVAQRFNGKQTANNEAEVSGTD